jgi:SAM-dependent methyltransferase
VADELTRRIYTTWERMAPGWEERRQSIWDDSAHVGRQLVDAVDPRPGETILELAAGVGDTGLLAAERVGPDGLVISSDLSPAMVEAARRRGAELGIAGVDFRVLDAQALELPDDSVDAVVCRWGYMLMPDPAAALRETSRVLRPGGRLAFSVWASPARNPWAASVAGVLVEHGHMSPPEQGAPGIFALADPARLEALVVAAGFEPPRLTEVEMTWRFESFDDYWAYTLEAAGGLAIVIDQLPPRGQEAVRDAARDVLGPPAGGPMELTGLCLNALTRVPG